MTPLIDARNLVKRYGDRVAVSGVSLSVAPGEVVAVIGPNGAGKSTTLEMILGLRSRDGGEVRYGCADPRREIGVQLQSTPFFPGLTAAKNLRVFAAFYGRRLSREETDELLARCRLQHAARTEASRLSGGEQKRLAIAVALVHRPRALFLDEPTAALEPRARHEIRNLIKELAEDGTAVVFTSHDMEEVGRLADRVVLIVGGRVRAEGAPQALLERHGAASLDELYLNLTEEAV